MLILTSVGLNFVIIFTSQTLSIKLLTNITNNLYDFRDTAILENELFTPTDYFLRARCYSFRGNTVSEKFSCHFETNYS